jgi:hypothetical protein
MQGYLIMAIIIAMMAGIGGLYYKDSQKTIGILQGNVAKAEVATKLAKSEIKAMAEAQAKQEVLIAALNKEMIKADEEVAGLRKLYRKHDLTNLALKKPERIKKIINAGTMKIFKELENETAVPSN